MVGFPGEREADFEQTLKVVRELRFDSLFSFVYSPRPNTPAADWPDQVPKEIAAEWLSRLQTEQQQISQEILQTYLGKRVEILVESTSVSGNVKLYS